MSLLGRIILSDRVAIFTKISLDHLKAQPKKVGPLNLENKKLDTPNGYFIKSVGGRNFRTPLYQNRDFITPLYQKGIFCPLYQNGHFPSPHFF